MESKCTGNSLNSSQGIAGVHVPFGAECSVWGARAVFAESLPLLHLPSAAGFI